MEHANKLTPNSKNKPAGSSEDKAIAQVVAMMEHYQGPIPKASEFQAYERIHKGAADRILKMAETSLKAEVRYGYFDRGTQLISMLLGKCFLYVLVFIALYLVTQNKPVEALLTGLAPIVSAIYATFRSRK